VPVLLLGWDEIHDLVEQIRTFARQ